MKHYSSLLKNTRGGDFLEYIIICGVVALVAVVAFTAFGKNVQTKIQDEGTNVSNIADQ